MKWVWMTLGMLVVASLVLFAVGYNSLCDRGRESAHIDPAGESRDRAEPQPYSLWVEFEADAPDGSPQARGVWTQVVPWVPQAACLAETQQRLEAADQARAPEVTYERQGDRITTIALGPSPDRGMRRQWTLWCLPAEVDPLSPPGR